MSTEAHWVEVKWQANANAHAGLGQVHVKRSGEAIHDGLLGHMPIDLLHFMFCLSTAAQPQA